MNKRLWHRLKQNRDDLKCLVNSTTLGGNGVDAVADGDNRFGGGIGSGLPGRVVGLGARESAIDHALEHGNQ